MAGALAPGRRIRRARAAIAGPGRALAMTAGMPVRAPVGPPAAPFTE
jgi:hypothetical protein